ncbi:MAG: HD domain-containing phosphohydrolase [Arcobacteraceae bacterium]
MQKDTSIRRKLYSLASIIGTTYIIFHLILFIFANDIKTKWDIYDQNIKEKNLIISKIMLDIGYNGMIHHYKDYVISKENSSLEQFNIKYNSFLQHKEAYLKFSNVTSLETEQLKKIEATLLLYKNSIETHSFNLTINDTPAIEALAILDTFFAKKRAETSKNMDTTIHYVYYLSIFVILSILFFTIYFKRFLENTVIEPLLKIERGLISFFKFLSNKKYSIEPIHLKSNDEFGIMAKSINKNIDLASKLHHNITAKNEELESLIESYSKNVIASKTDTKGFITYTSEAFEEISGYTKEELIGKPHSIVRHPDMTKDDFRQMWETIQSGESWQGEVKNRKKNGDYYYVKASVAPIFNANKDITGYSAIREDITQQKEIIELNKQLDVYKRHLETKVINATSHIEELMIEIEETQKEVVFTMGAIGERRSEETGFHVKRVAEYSKLFALYCGLDEKEAEMLRQASPMHDIGKVGIADSILNKPGLFTPEEHKMMQEHTTLGYNMLKSSKRPLLQTAAIVANEHHERWDGKGYPNGLAGEAIHIYGRITSIADVFDALGSDRVYKKAWEDERIFQLFKDERGKQFDPKLVDIFFAHLDEFLGIRQKCQD